MTRKLYYEDSYLTRTVSTVTGCVKTDRGYEVTLDATVFYPEGGGQPCDLGRLGEARVLDVQERGEEVIHLCDRPLSGTVEGHIDWERRFDLMQQHSGEHIVSGILCARYGCHNVGFHMGAEMITIDLDAPIPPEDLPSVEAEADRAVWADQDVRCWIPSPEELPHVPYRTKRALPWPVRIVQIGDVDSCACCGTHVRRTGQIGIIKIFSCVRFHQGVRIEMACGGRALAILNAVYDQNRQVCRAFSAKPLETGEAARRMNERLAAAEFRATGLQRQIFDTVAAGYAGKGDVLHIREGLSPNELRELADRIATVCGGTAAVASPTPEGHAICMVDKQRDIRSLGSAMNQALDGRGGGRTGYFQGSVKADKATLEAFWRSRQS